VVVVGGQPKEEKQEEAAVRLDDIGTSATETFKAWQDDAITSPTASAPSSPAAGRAAAARRARAAAAAAARAHPLISTLGIC
jgi:hypothetical protein